MSNLGFLFSQWSLTRINVTYIQETEKYLATIVLGPPHDAIGVFSTGDTPDTALQRAAEGLDKPERWRKLKF
jgi:hypothetical protein